MAANAFDDRIRFGSLYEIYGALLTEKQRQCLELYFCEDYSLAEVAEEMQVSRQAIHDLLRRVEQTLEHYETMLGFLQRMENTRRLTVEAAAILDSAAKKRKDTDLSRLREILEELNDESR
ncbi:MAG: YlxM family DNA-binding protein [Acidaminococcaceae bacterium]|nr:YlxM family DNA-binding protein [Acidaminococcaceae bacterium]